MSAHRAGHQAFLGIAKDWGLTIDEQCVVLGGMSRSTFIAMKRNPEYIFSDEQLARISYIMGIHKALRMLPVGRSKQNLRRWLREPQNSEYAPLFEGKSALQKILVGRVMDLAEMRRYLDALCS